MCDAVYFPNVSKNLLFPFSKCVTQNYCNPNVETVRFFKSEVSIYQNALSPAHGGRYFQEKSNQYPKTQFLRSHSTFIPWLFFHFMALQPSSGLRRLVEVSRSHTGTHSRQDSSGWVSSSSQIPLRTQHTTNKTEEHPCPQQAGSPQFLLTYTINNLPRCLRRRYVAAHLMGLRVQIPSGAWICVPWDCSMLSGRGPATGWSLVQRSPAECGVSECDRVSLIMRRSWTH